MRACYFALALTALHHTSALESTSAPSSPFLTFASRVLLAAYLDHVLMGPSARHVSTQIDRSRAPRSRGSAAAKSSSDAPRAPGPPEVCGEWVASGTETSDNLTKTNVTEMAPVRICTRKHERGEDEWHSLPKKSLFAKEDHTSRTWSQSAEHQDDKRAFSPSLTDQVDEPGRREHEETQARHAVHADQQAHTGRLRYTATTTRNAHELDAPDGTRQRTSLSQRLPLHWGGLVEGCFLLNSVTGWLSVQGVPERRRWRGSVGVEYNGSLVLASPVAKDAEVGITNERVMGTTRTMDEACG
ncbi:uncharacterized protein C8Q71DRAFT_851939 [Rhodofomes roseus]|uniref:Uncharacterized protein n=1 Tax=Rhodofomes roseus TaxID=34475 RepID=A0ABQ8JXB4_9APHY|nr:uncharacterized protein C8Q71DRAFT_851939 [Rhodofomes roseus]KAH9828725.1 hypothetical protein C8Q71DRAFT_851939 [Rhodofomes roseus]